ncbi:MAG: PEP-CTERM sorting domain-containing protein [Microcystis aeruginosa W13-11]|nr:PEP-CTERM sorting domain-containing protein [Microcystis aeruginosa W13-11]
MDNFRIVASDIPGDIGNVSTLEPTSTLGLLSLGILGAGATLKRKVKRSHSTEKEPSNVG